MSQVTLVLIVICAVGSGLIAGIFYAFSTFVMKALARLPTRDGLAAMNAISVAVINPLFLGPFMGTAVICIIAMVIALVRWESPRSIFVICAALLYVLGTFGVTMWFNVPLNNMLAKVSPEDADLEAHWRDYVSRWTRWNHVRTGAAVVAMMLFVWALT